MSRVKIIGAALGVMFALSAVTSTSALASTESWYVSGSKLASGSAAALSTKIAVDKPIVINTPGLPLKISCPSLGATSPKIVGESTLEVASLKFGECSVIEPTTCTLSTPEINTEPSKGDVHEVLRIFGVEVYLWFASGPSKDASFTLDGSSCAISGVKALTGHFATEGPTLEKEEVTQAVLALGSIENNSLQLANSRTYIENGEFLLKLESGSKWSFH
jgi:hypothetical protein